jgi:hypothetical protein
VPYHAVVADQHDPTVGGIDEVSHSPAERTSHVPSRGRQDDVEQQPRRTVLPTEFVLLSVIAAVALLVVSGLVQGFGVSPQQGVSLWDLWGGAATQWANVPLAVTLLGAALLASYQSLHCCDEIERCLDEREAVRDATHDAELALEPVSALTWGVRHLRRSRWALISLAVLGLATAAASITHLVWEFAVDGYGSPGTTWYAKSDVVALTVAVVIPALACVVIAPKVWGRGSELLRADPEGWFENEPEHPEN